MVARGVKGLCFHITKPFDEVVPTISELEGRNFSCCMVPALLGGAIPDT
jgi:hypothetical protein